MTKKRPTRRQGRSVKSFKRKYGFIIPEKIVLIVCEGEKTEPYYFKGLRDTLRLTNVKVEITSSRQGSSPKNVFKYAKKEFELKEGVYDKVFCVFDKDDHSTFQRSLSEILKLSKKYRGKFEAIVSIPCFEIWLLLHFKFTTKTFYVQDRGSACHQVIRELTTYFPEYEKAKKDIYERTKDKLDLAIKNAKRLERHNHEIGIYSTATNVFKLIEYLQSLNGN